MADSPSYLIRRNAIFYFQARIPQDSVLYMKYKKKLIRRSTRTGNKREAMRIARTWWVELMGQADKEIDTQHEQFMVGRDLHAGLEKFDDIDEDGITDFLSGITEYEKDALNLFIDEMNKRKTAATRSTNYAPTNSQNAKTSPALSKVLEDYIYYNSERRQKTWRASSLKKFKGQLYLFLRMVGDIPVHTLTTEVVRDDFANKLIRLPSRIEQTAKYKNGEDWKAIDEIISIVEKDGDKIMSYNTVASYARTITQFLKHVKKKGYVEVDLYGPLAECLEIADNPENKRLPFTNDEVRAMFESKEFRTGIIMKYPERYWIPLISLFTGARRTEIAQMDIMDIVYDSDCGVYFFNIHDEDLKEVKTESSIRYVPIHPILIELGLFRYTKWLESKGETRLFPREKLPDCGRKASRWFNGEYKESKTRGRYFHNGHKHNCGVVIEENTMKDLHSFRHWLINLSKQCHAVEEVITEITGHKGDKRKTAHDGYKQAYGKDVRAEELMKLPFEDIIDFSVIKRWP